MPLKHPTALHGHFLGQCFGAQALKGDDFKRENGQEMAPFFPQSCTDNGLPTALNPDANPAGTNAPVNKPGFGGCVLNSAPDTATDLLSKALAHGSRSHLGPLGAAERIQTQFFPICTQPAKTTPGSGLSPSKT